MYQRLATVTLKNGESVEAGVVRGPEPGWAQRLVRLLWHKGDPWNWQNAQVLERTLGIDAFFYILHRDGAPLANIMTIELEGVGLFGHVWTNPEDRQKGASGSLLQLLMADFAARNGRALYLGTGYDSVPYHLYAKHGFQGIAPASGYMAYYRAAQADFDAAYFAPGEAVIEPLDWRHWPAAAPLFIGDFPGLVRCAPLQLIGRESPEGPFLPALLKAEERAQRGRTPTTFALRHAVTNAVVGLATCDWHPLWPETRLLDLYCHPNFWHYAPALLEALPFTADQRLIAYADQGCPAKLQTLAAVGFKTTATLPQWIATDALQSNWADVLVLTKQ
ncbi:MAG: hypothetical protein R3C14_01815 [Caldilineaceae bacterium]